MCTSSSSAVSVHDSVATNGPSTLVTVRGKPYCYESSDSPAISSQAVALELMTKQYSHNSADSTKSSATSATSFKMTGDWATTTSRKRTSKYIRRRFELRRNSGSSGGTAKQGNAIPVLDLERNDHLLSGKRKLITSFSPRQNEESAATPINRQIPLVGSKAQPSDTKLKKSKLPRISKEGPMCKNIPQTHNNSNFAVESHGKMKPKDGSYLQPPRTHPLSSDPKLSEFLENVIRSICYSSTSRIPANSFPSQSSELLTAAAKNKPAVTALSLRESSVARPDHLIVQETNRKHSKSRAVCKVKSLYDSSAFKPAKSKKNVVLCILRNASQLNKLTKQHVTNVVKDYLRKKSSSRNAWFSESSIEVEVERSEGYISDKPASSCSIDGVPADVSCGADPADESCQFQVGCLKYQNHNLSHKLSFRPYPQYTSSDALDKLGNELSGIKETVKRKSSVTIAICNAPSTGTKELGNWYHPTHVLPGRVWSKGEVSTNHVHRKHGKSRVNRCLLSDRKGEELNWYNRNEDSSIENLEFSCTDSAGYDNCCSNPKLEHDIHTIVGIPVMPHLHRKRIQTKQRQVISGSENKTCRLRDNDGGLYHPGSVIESEVMEHVGNGTMTKTGSQSNAMAMSKLASMISKDVSLCVKNAFQEVLKTQVCKNADLTSSLQSPKANSCPKNHPFNSKIPRPRQPLTHSSLTGYRPFSEPQTCLPCRCPSLHGPLQSSCSYRSHTTPAPHEWNEAEIFFYQPVNKNSSHGLINQEKLSTCRRSTRASLTFEGNMPFYSALLQSGKVVPETNTERMSDKLPADKPPSEQATLSRKLVSVTLMKQSVERKVSTSKQLQDFRYCKKSMKPASTQSYCHLSSHFMGKGQFEPKVPELACIGTSGELGVSVAQTEPEGKASAEDQEGREGQLKTAVKSVAVSGTSALKESRDSDNDVLGTVMTDTRHEACQVSEMRDIASGDKIKFQFKDTIDIEIHLKISVPDKNLLARKEIVQTIRSVTQESQTTIEKRKLTVEDSVPALEEKPAKGVDNRAKIKKPLPRYRLPTQSSSLRDSVTSEYIKKIRHDRMSPRYLMMVNTRKRTPSNLERLAHGRKMQGNKPRVRSCQLRHETIHETVSQTVYSESCSKIRRCLHLKTKSTGIGLITDPQIASMPQIPWQVGSPVGRIAIGAKNFANKCKSTGTVEQHCAKAVQTSQRHIFSNNNSSSSTSSETKPIPLKEERGVYSDSKTVVSKDSSRCGLSTNCSQQRKLESSRCISTAGANSESENLGYTVHLGAVNCHTVGCAKAASNDANANGNSESEHLSINLRECKVVNASYNQLDEKKLSLDGKTVKSCCCSGLNKDGDDCSSIGCVKKLWRSWATDTKQ